MQETCCKLDLTQKIFVKLLQHLVTEHTDRVTATQPCKVYPIQSVTECLPTKLGSWGRQTASIYKIWLQPTVYRVYRPGAGCTALTVQCFTQTGCRVSLPSPFNSVLILGQADSKYLQDMASTDRLQSLPTRYQLYSPQCTVLHQNRLQNLRT